MAELYVSRPAAPAGEGKTHGGFADIARLLNARHPERQIPISRQLVAKWYAYREKNGFPERRPIGGEDGKPVFDLQAVERWHTGWLRERNGGDPPIETIPLFHLDVRGHPVDAEQGSYRGHPAVRESSYRSSILDL
jgi:hypothetical protein